MSEPTPQPGLEVASLDRLNEMRAAGWVVAVHNDYRQNGTLHTFWLLTDPYGRFVKGEGQSDSVALVQCAAAIRALAASVSPVSPDGVDAFTLTDVFRALYAFAHINGIPRDDSYHRLAREAVNAMMQRHLAARQDRDRGEG